MINSRDINDLHPIVRSKALDFIQRAKALGIDVLITSTFRDFESQDALYALGRTRAGSKVTNAKGGQSFHNFRVAFDFVPLRHGKPVWSTSGDDGKLWQQLGELGEACGLEWAGRWVNFKEMAHMQFTKGLTLKDFQSGRTIDG